MQERLGKWLRSGAAKGGLMVALVLIGQRTGEWYPLSHFPMYSSFGDSQWYVFVTDEVGRPIAVEKTFSLRCAYLKKIFNAQAGKLRSESQAAEKALQMLAKRAPSDLAVKGLELHRRDIKKKHGRITTTEKRLARIDL